MALASEWRTGSSGLGHAELRETVRFVVDARTPISLHSLVEKYVAPLRDLVTFAAQTPPVIWSVRVAGAFSTEQTAGGRTIKRASELLLPFLEGATSGKPERLRRRLLSIPTDPRAFRALMGSWLRLREELAPVIDLRFAATYARFMYGENRFINAVQSVEALHRRVLAGDPDPSDIEAREAALGACPQDHRSWLEAKLQYAHEPTLRRRLRETLDFIGSGIRPAVGNRSRFVNAVVTTRNALTHWDQQQHHPDGEPAISMALHSFWATSWTQRCFDCSASLRTRFGTRFRRTTTSVGSHLASLRDRGPVRGQVEAALHAASLRCC